MRTIAIFNLKGGVAKTVTAATMAYCLADDHKRSVLCIDADGQGNLSQYFGVEAVEGASTLDLIQGKTEPYYGDWIPTAKPNIDVIAADMRLSFADVDAIKDGRCDLTAMESLRQDMAEDQAYDFVLIDCPPAFSAASSAALAAADEVIIPVRLDAFSTAGMAELTEQVRNMRRINSRLQVAGILVTQYQHTAEEQTAHAYLKAQSGLPVFRTRIRMSKRVAPATYARESLLTFSPHCGAAKDYRRFVDEYLERGGCDNG